MNSTEKTRQLSEADYWYGTLRKNWKAKRPQNPKEMLDRAIAQDNPENIPDMYNEDAWQNDPDMDRKYQAERWDR